MFTRRFIAERLVRVQTRNDHFDGSMTIGCTALGTTWMRGDYYGDINANSY
jgi:hypothetical protein